MTRPVETDAYGDPNVARTEARAIAGELIERNPQADPRSLLKPLWDALGQLQLQQDFVKEALLCEIRKALADVEAHAGGDGFDRPPATAANGAALARAPAPRKAKGGWKEWLAADKPRVRAALMDMTKEECLNEIERLKSEGMGSLKQAAALAELAAPLAPGERVKDRWTGDELRERLADVDARAAWVRVEEVAGSPATRELPATTGEGATHDGRNLAAD